ncbi:alanine racemase [Candidatus Riflebacteria bacterium]
MLKVEIDLTKLRKNIDHLKKLSGNKKLLPVVKANAYGHGATGVALFLEQEGYRKLAVYDFEEALELWEGGVRTQILLFCPCTEEQLDICQERNFIPTIYDEESLKFYAKKAANRNHKMPFALHFSTGMNFLGLQPEIYLSLLSSSLEEPGLILTDVYSHLSDGEAEDGIYSRAQFQYFKHLTVGISKIANTHLLNTAGILNLGTLPIDTIRPGAGIYGYCLGDKDHPFQPVMRVSGTLCAVRKLKKGQTIGYNRTYKVKKDSYYGVFSVGYARGLTTGGFQGLDVLIAGMRHPIVGKVSMDKVAIYLADELNGNFDLEQEVVLLGQQKDERIDAEEIGNKTSRIFYEVLCHLCPTSKRIYKKSENDLKV